MADKKTTGKKTPEEAAANQAESQKNPGPTSPLAQADRRLLQATCAGLRAELAVLAG